MNSTIASISLSRWYLSESTFAGISRYAVFTATTPLRCAYRVYQIFEQLAYVLCTNPWKHKIPGAATVLSFGVRCLLLDLFSVCQPLLARQLCIRHIPNQPALAWGLPFGSGSKSLKETAELFSKFSPIQPSVPYKTAITEGHCWGISLHFLSLFYKERRHTPDAVDRIHSISGRLTGGATRKAQHLQSLGCTRPLMRRWECALLIAQEPLWIALNSLSAGAKWVVGRAPFGATWTDGLRQHLIANQEGYILPYAGLGVRSIQTIDSAAELNRCGCDTYLVRQGWGSFHEMVYIKLSPTLSYTLNPGWGLYVHSGKQQAQNAAHALGIGGSDEIRLIKVGPSNFLDWNPWNLPRRRVLMGL